MNAHDRDVIVVPAGVELKSVNCFDCPVIIPVVPPAIPKLAFGVGSCTVISLENVAERLNPSVIVNVGV